MVNLDLSASPDLNPSCLTPHDRCNTIRLYNDSQAECADLDWKRAELKNDETDGLSAGAVDVRRGGGVVRNLHPFVSVCWRGQNHRDETDSLRMAPGSAWLCL